MEEWEYIHADNTTKIGLALGVSTFLWLYTSIHGYKPAKAVVTSELPLGSGLGSSAAFCVASSAALLALSDSVTIDFSHQGWQMFGGKLDGVNLAFTGEIFENEGTGCSRRVEGSFEQQDCKVVAMTLGIRSLKLFAIVTNLSSTKFYVTLYVYVLR
ncbi:Mevalonate kinase [Abeliophyllum distichum]|uniref:mevalonate kinase n=1 Tax=Abeliophyllum distichum TaxID=126358 RepID=A0ABD1RTG8_9LAMI